MSNLVKNIWLTHFNPWIHKHVRRNSDGLEQTRNKPEQNILNQFGAWKEDFTYIFEKRIWPTHLIHWIINTFWERVGPEQTRNKLEKNHFELFWCLESTFNVKLRKALLATHYNTWKHKHVLRKLVDPQPTQNELEETILNRFGAWKESLMSDLEKHLWLTRTPKLIVYSVLFLYSHLSKYTVIRVDSFEYTIFSVASCMHISMAWSTL